MNKLQILVFIAFLESVPTFMEMGFVFWIRTLCYATIIPDFQTSNVIFPVQASVQALPFLPNFR